MRSAEGSPDKTIVGLVIALIFAVLAAVGYPLIRPAQQPSYAAVRPPAHATLTRATDTATAIILYQHRAMAHEQKVVLDAYLKAQAIKAAKAAAVQKAQVAAQQAQQQSGGGISTAGFSAFKACVALRESTNGKGSSNIYGILGGLWPGVPSDPWYSIALPYRSAWDAPASVQSRVFDLIYQQQGTAPWAPYDGC